MKKAIIITPFDNYSYQVRIKYVERYLSERGYDVKIISSDFDHRNKKVYTARRDNLELIHVSPYKKNLSYARINSHRIFAKKAFERLKEENPELIYCSAPPNYLFKYTSQYKKKNPKVKLSYELGELWPETLPLQGKIKKLASPVLQVWAGIRDKNIGYADGIIYECEMFKDVVSKAYSGVDSRVIYLSKEDYYDGDFTLTDIDNNVLRFAYVGSINNIIDIELIVDILKKLSSRKSVMLAVIGGGENAEKLFRLCKENGIQYENHGITYDEEIKHRILSTCHFGINIMKNSVAVGATMKSLEYFHEGMILINNIPYDTEMIIDRYKCGINIKDMQIDSIIGLSGNIEARMNSRKAFEDLFCEKAVEKKFNDFLDDMGV